LWHFDAPLVFVFVVKPIVVVLVFVLLLHTDSQSSVNMLLFYHAAFQQITAGPLLSIDGKREKQGGGGAEKGAAEKWAGQGYRILLN